MDTTSDVLSVWWEIDAGFTAQATKDHEKYWKACQRYDATWNIDPFLQDCEKMDIIILVIDFSARVRKGLLKSIRCW